MSKHKNWKNKNENFLLLGVWNDGIKK